MTIRGMAMDYLSRLRCVCRFRGLTTLAIADKLGITENQLFSYLVDGQVPSDNLDFRISAILGIPSGSLKSEEGEKLVLARSSAPSGTALALRALLSIAGFGVLFPLLLLGVSAIVIFFGLFFSGSKELSFLFLVIGTAIILSTFGYFGYRFGFFNSVRRGRVDAEFMLGGIVLTGQGSVQTISYKTLAGSLEETDTCFVVCPDGGSALFLPKAGLASVEVGAVREQILAAESGGASMGYSCCSFPARRTFIEESDLLVATRLFGHHIVKTMWGTQVGWLFLGLALSLGLCLPLSAPLYLIGVPLLVAGLLGGLFFAFDLLRFGKKSSYCLKSGAKASISLAAAQAIAGLVLLIVGLI